MSGARTDRAVRLLFGGLLAVLAFGAWTGFPVFDDAYMVLFLREASVGALQAQHPHRPLFGLLLRLVTQAFGTHRAPYVAMAASFWALLAWQTGCLCRRLAPSADGVGSLAGLLTLAPILVSTQYTTATTVLPANLPVSLGLAALLLVLAEDPEPRSGRLLVAGLLVVVSVIVSEYGIAAAAAAAALLLVYRRFRSSFVFLAGALVGYGVFRATADLSVRVRQVPSAQVGVLLGRPQVAVVRFIDGLWTCFLGSWAGAAGAVRVSFSERWTLLAAVLGLLAAAALAFRVFEEGTSPSGPFEGRSGIALFAAVGAGILPVVMANRSLTSGDPYESRYLLPVLPFAAAAVSLGLLRISRGRYRRVVVGVAAFVAAYRIAAGAFEVRQEQRRMEEIGRLLHPLVRDSSGLTVAVVPDRWNLEGSDLTPKVTWAWNESESRRAWVMPASRAAAEFGARNVCHAIDTVSLGPELMSTPRVGALSHLVWLPVWDGRLGELEPYCVGP